MKCKDKYFFDEAEKWVRSLGLIPHPEGGYFRETYRSSDTIPGEIFGSRFGGTRNICTAIYYLVTAGNFSAFHRIRSDEIWHFYAGGALELHMLNEGRHTEVRIGLNVEAGELIQYVVPAGVWFASAPAPNEAYSLLGCTVCPGFDYSDFEVADRDTLTKEFPEQTALIRRLTRSG